MSDAPKDWEGQVIDGIFPLKKYLGGSDHSAVFLTEYAEGEKGTAAIKFIPADRATADLVLTNWRVAAQMNHPNLLRIFRAGRCRLEGNDLLYLVMEQADEDLADILPVRALTAEEARDMLNPVLDALEYLHGKGFVHGGLKPVNILASADQLKLSSDMISRSGEAQSALKKSSVYDPPESITGMKTMAGDVWALGTTLVEVLTQKVPDWQPGPHREPLVPETVPAPFADIARACLRLEPDRRATVADIAERLNTRVSAASPLGAVAAANARSTAPAAAPPTVSAAAAATAGASGPASAGAAPAPSASAATAASMPMPSIAPAKNLPPLSPTAAPPASRAPYSVRAAVPAAPSAPAKRIEKREPLVQRPPMQRPAPDWSKYFGAVVAAALLFAALLTVPWWFRHKAQNAPVVSTVAEAPAEATADKPTPAVASPAKKPAKKAANPETSNRAPSTPTRTAKGLPPSADGSSLQPAIEKEPAAPSSTSANLTVPATSNASAKPVPARLDASKGEVLDQVMPDVSDKAHATIHGHVRVAVRVHVDAAGAVSAATLESPGPSAFFADAALRAARQWTFTPPEANGKSVPSEWVLHFVFTSSDTKVTPSQVTP